MPDDQLLDQTTGSPVYEVPVSALEGLVCMQMIQDAGSVPESVVSQYVPDGRSRDFYEGYVTAMHVMQGLLGDEADQDVTDMLIALLGRAARSCLTG